MRKHKYEQAVSECDKRRRLIKAVFGKNITVISKRELDTLRTEYGENINNYEISNSIHEKYDVWNESDIETVTDKKRGKYLSTLLNDYDRSLSVSRNFLRILNINFQTTNVKIM